MIKYRYALDIEDNLIDINNLKRNEIKKTEKYFSIDFKQELIPRLGQNNRKHFSRKADSNIIGSKETYLHALGKKIFFDEYSKCLYNKTSINFKYPINKLCNRLEKQYNIICNLEAENGYFDLVSYYTQIIMEKRNAGFIPDLLLLNPKTNQKIYIEIAVNHRISDEKKNSGIRIIEFLLLTEENVPEIIEFINHGECKITRYFNFNPKQEKGIYCTEGHCINKFNIFSVSDNGKCNLEIIKERDVREKVDILKTQSIWYILELYEFKYYEEIYSEQTIFCDILLYYIAQAVNSNITVKNCHICRYHSKNIDWRRFKKRESIFCKFLNKTVILILQ